MLDTTEQDPPLLESAPLTPEQATLRINKIANSSYTFCWTEDVKQKIRSLNLIITDLHYVLKLGRVTKPGKACKTALYWKYIIEYKTPNFINKNLKVVVILGAAANELMVHDVID